MKIANRTKSTIEAIEGDVIQISQHTRDTKKSELLVVFPGGFYVSQEVSKEDLVSKLGEPEPQGHFKDRYTWRVESDYLSSDLYTIVIKDGIIDEITLDHISG